MGKMQISAERDRMVRIQTQTGISPINTKIQAITEKLKPENLKELRSYLGAVNQMNRFLPNLTQLCFKLRPLLKNG